ncbi:MAG: hypothetical protein R3F37_00320 [Candidatus Competibacteraceae bacterium]
MQHLRLASLRQTDRQAEPRREDEQLKDGTVPCGRDGTVGVGLGDASPRSSVLHDAR